MSSTKLAAILSRERWTLQNIWKIMPNFAVTLVPADDLTLLCDRTSANKVVCASMYERTHYIDVMMSAIASQITSLTIIYSAVYSGADQRKHQSSVSLAFEWGIHRWPVNSPHKGPVTRKKFHHANVCKPGDACIYVHSCICIYVLFRIAINSLCPWPI